MAQVKNIHMDPLAVGRHTVAPGEVIDTEGISSSPQALAALHYFVGRGYLTLLEGELPAVKQAQKEEAPAEIPAEPQVEIQAEPQVEAPVEIPAEPQVEAPVEAPAPKKSSKTRAPKAE